MGASATSFERKRFACMYSRALCSTSTIRHPSSVIRHPLSVTANLPWPNPKLKKMKASLLLNENSFSGFIPTEMGDLKMHAM